MKPSPFPSKPAAHAALLLLQNLLGALSAPTQACLDTGRCDPLLHVPPAPPPGSPPL